MAKKDTVHRDAEAALTEQLRNMFESIAEQPVPGKLLDLVDALEERRGDRETSAEDL